MELKRDIEAFYSTVKTKVDITNQFRHLYGKTLSPDFNAFSFWHIDENKVSEILAFLLNPKGTHDQGDIFLKLFVQKFDLKFEYNANDKIIVKCEHITDKNRRIDILISKNDNESIIGIENKIYAGTADQNNQVIDYLAYLAGRSADYCLFYLAPAEKRIGEHSLSKKDFESYTSEKKLRMISYEFDIIELIHSFALHCESERVRFFILEFEKKLRQMFMGEESINDNKFITGHILENVENLELSFKIMKGLNEAKMQLQNQFKNELKDIGEQFDLEVNDLKLTPKSWRKYHITFSYESSGILYGLTRVNEDKNKPGLKEVQDLFPSVKFTSTPWWPMWAYFYEGINYNEQFWLDIKSGKARDRAKEFVEKLQPLFLRNDF
jgi:hypothetical protein